MRRKLGNGLVTTAAVLAMAFVAVAFADGGPDKRSNREAGRHGMMGHGHGGMMGQVGMLLDHLEKVGVATAPADFNLERHPEADTNGDGQVSDSEWLTFAEQARPRLLARLLTLAPQADGNGDGTIGDSELATFKSERFAKHREQVLAKNPDADADGDGALSKAEFMAFHAKRAESHSAMMLERHPEADTDGDGVLSKAEAHAFKGSGHGSHGMMAQGHGGGGMAGHGQHRMMGQVSMVLSHFETLDGQSAPADFNLERHPEADANGDGQVSDSEWLTFAEQTRPRLLARLLTLAPQADGDGDGTIGDSELATFKSKRFAKHREHVLAKNPDADSDGDGALSKAEFMAFHAKRAEGHRAMVLESHPDADTNGDGVLSEAEAQAFMGSGHGGGCPAHPDGCPHSKGKVQTRGVQRGHGS